MAEQGSSAAVGVVAGASLNQAPYPAQARRSNKQMNLDDYVDWWGPALIVLMLLPFIALKIIHWHRFIRRMQCETKPPPAFSDPVESIGGRRDEDGSN